MSKALHSNLTILIPAAGTGDRLGLGPKAWLKIGEKSLLNCLAEKAKTVASTVIIAAPVGGSERLAALCPDCLVIEGQTTRQETIKSLVDANQSPWLLIQDAARPFVTTSLLHAVTNAAKETGVAGAFLPPEVPVGLISNGLVTAQFPASDVGIFQAPQVFSREILNQSLLMAEENNWITQSTMQLVLHAGHKVRAVTGEKTNIKLTTPPDWLLAQSLEDFL